MATVEDVFDLYERNSYYYHNCKGTKCIQLNDDVECFCYLCMTVYPVTIGDATVPCSFKRKRYIKPKEDCSICLDKIVKKTDAYLTPCGHSFHKLCIFKTLENKPFSSLKCPNCRSKIGNPELISRYSGETELDRLENFWITKELENPVFCSNKGSGPNVHYLGLNKGCNTCKNYVKYGDR